MFRGPRTWLGLFLALLGIVLVRIVSPMVSPGELATIVYVVGVALALGGLALVASAMQVTQVSVITCPKCYLVNSAESQRCARCDSPLHDDDGGRGQQ